MTASGLSFRQGKSPDLFRRPHDRPSFAVRHVHGLGSPLQRPRALHAGKQFGYTGSKGFFIGHHTDCDLALQYLIFLSVHDGLLLSGDIFVCE